VGFEVDSGTGAGFLRVLQFPLLHIFSLISPESSSAVTESWCNRPMTAVIMGSFPIQLHRYIEEIKKSFRLGAA
jgi:hypothetical protein